MKDISFKYKKKKKKNPTLEKIILSQHREEIHYLKIVNYDNFIYDFTIVYDKKVYYIGALTPNSKLVFIVPKGKENFELYGKSGNYAFHLNIGTEPSEMEYPYSEGIPRGTEIVKRYDINLILLKKDIYKVINQKNSQGFFFNANF